MQLEEEELNRKRAANKTALEAIGGKKKKRKLDEALESLANVTTPGSTASTTTNSNTISQVCFLLLWFMLSIPLNHLNPITTGVFFNRVHLFARRLK